MSRLNAAQAACLVTARPPSPSVAKTQIAGCHNVLLGCRMMHLMQFRAKFSRVAASSGSACGGRAAVWGGSAGLGFGVEQQELIWAMWRRGDAVREMERALGETLPRIRRYLRHSGGIAPIPRQRRADHLTLVEREEISRGIAAGLSARLIARRIDRPSSTVSREIARNGGRDAYRALVADAAAFERRGARNRANWPPTRSYGAWSPPSWKTIGHHSRSPSGCGGSISVTQRCISRMSRSTVMCACRRGKCLTPLCFTAYGVTVRSDGRAERSARTVAARSAT